MAALVTGGLMLGIYTVVKVERYGWTAALRALGRIGYAVPAPRPLKPPVDEQSLGVGAENLDRAALSLDHALEVLSFEAAPEAWLHAHYHRGQTYLFRRGGDRNENFARALESLQIAVQHLTPERDPRFWSMLMTQIGQVQLHRTEIDAAIASIEQALTVDQTFWAPQTWANTQLLLAGLRLGMTADENTLRHDPPEPWSHDGIADPFDMSGNLLKQSEILAENVDMRRVFEEHVVAFTKGSAPAINDEWHVPPMVDESVVHLLRHFDKSVTAASLWLRNPAEREELESQRAQFYGFMLEQAVGRWNAAARTRALLDRYDGESLLVYCATRRQVDDVKQRLRHAGYLVGSYHAGLNDKQREHVQDAFMAGDVPILVATNAFGMGVDKSDVRGIVHYNVPGSIEGYYQEAGRAGRDGEPAHCLLLYSAQDRGVHEFFVETSYPTPDVVAQVWSELRRHGVGTHALGPEQIAQQINRTSRSKTRIHNAAVDAALRLLEGAAHVDFGWRDGFPWIAVRDHARERDLRIDWDQVVLRRRIAQRQLDQICRYAMGDGCRQAQLMRHFNNQASFGHNCNNCDACLGVPEYRGTSRHERLLIHDDPVTLVRKLLSGIARTQGRANTETVAAMLRGSTARRLQDLGFDRLSTYGVLSYLKPAEILELLDLCERHGLFAASARGFVALADEGVAVMRGTATLPPPLEGRLAKRVCVV